VVKRAAIVGVVGRSMEGGGWSRPFRMTAAVLSCCDRQGNLRPLGNGRCRTRSPRYHRVNAYLTSDTSASSHLTRATVYFLGLWLRHVRADGPLGIPILSHPGVPQHPMPSLSYTVLYRSVTFTTSSAPFFKVTMTSVFTRTHSLSQGARAPRFISFPKPFSFLLNSACLFRILLWEIS
jgi:hypothetical protein